MPARIRLRRMGRKKTPHYRVVVADSASPRDGRFVETLGYYKPLSQPARLVLDMERVDHWLEEGASPSGTVKSLISKARRGGDDTVALGEVDAEERLPPKPKLQKPARVKPPRPPKRRPLPTPRRLLPRLKRLLKPPPRRKPPRPKPKRPPRKRRSPSNPRTAFHGSSEPPRRRVSEQAPRHQG